MSADIILFHGYYLMTEKDKDTNLKERPRVYQESNCAEQWIEHKQYLLYYSERGGY